MKLIRLAEMDRVYRTVRIEDEGDDVLPVITRVNIACLEFVEFL